MSCIPLILITIPTDQSHDQQINHMINRSITWSTDQVNDQSHDQHINHIINRSITRSTDQPHNQQINNTINRSITWSTTWSTNQSHDQQINHMIKLSKCHIYVTCSFVTKILLIIFTIICMNMLIRLLIGT